MSKLLVRSATSDDIDTIRAWEQEAFGLTWNRETFLKELERQNGCTVVAEWNRQAIGAALLVWAADEVQLNSFVLDSEWRGQGLSKLFLGTLLAWCRERELSWMTLEVKWNNRPAHALYRRLGFVTTARRREYYSDGQDARLMWAGHLRSPRFSGLLSAFSGSIS